MAEDSHSMAIKEILLYIIAKQLQFELVYSPPSRFIVCHSVTANESTTQPTRLQLPDCVGSYELR
jgi:hypothetical protein